MYVNYDMIPDTNETKISTQLGSKFLVADLFSDFQIETGGGVCCVRIGFLTAPPV